MTSPIAKIHPRGPAASPDSGQRNSSGGAGGGASPVPRLNVASPPYKSPGRFSASATRSAAGGSPSQIGTVSGLDGSLLVDGMARSPARKSGCSSVFRSTTTTADAHIKALSSQFTKQSYAAAGVGTPRSGGGATAAFRSTSPSDRDSHIRDLARRAYASGAGRGASPGGGSSPARRELPSASFRSRSPIACAHIAAMTKPTDASYPMTTSAAGRSGASASAWARSTTSIADAHIRALNRPHESSSGSGSASAGSSFSRGGGGATSVFRSTTSIADAHIRALTKPVDVVVSYREIQGQ